MRLPSGIRFLLGMAAAVLVFSCGRPSSEEYFARSDGSGLYSFVLDMGDSLGCYDLDLLAVLSCGDGTFASFRGFPLNVVWTSPSGDRFTEEVWITGQTLEEGRHYSKRFYTPYREGLVPKDLGEWKLDFAVSPYFVREYSISGLGVKLSRRSWGTEN